MQRGEIWWASLLPPAGSGPGYRRPVLVIQSNEFTASRLSTVIVVALTSNLRLAAAPGNVLCQRKHTGLAKNSVANVSQMITLDKRILTARLGALTPRLLREVENGIRLVLGL